MVPLLFYRVLVLCLHVRLIQTRLKPRLGDHRYVDYAIFIVLAVYKAYWSFGHSFMRYINLAKSPLPGDINLARSPGELNILFIYIGHI